ncbi:hypothetical protein AUJ10_01400 [Candidatus Pacearchaeota archaeon CG1_02_31_27]|nr:MAG: hypothetical protein AUJ10_01400 [Candidatus Pacearchaeota archaeon CG1_02_31_27]
MDIINEMLLAIENKNGRIKPTHLMYKANLSYKLLKEYTDELITKGMIEKKDEKDKSFFEITKKGREFIYQFRKMIEFKNTFGI